MNGIVQTYKALKGWGWILHGFRNQYFYHIKDWRGDAPPTIGQQVSFDVAPPKKDGQREQAVNIVPAPELVQK